MYHNTPNQSTDIYRAEYRLIKNTRSIEVLVFDDEVVRKRRLKLLTRWPQILNYSSQDQIKISQTGQHFPTQQK